MNRSTVLMFSGQGSQYPYMGRELFRSEPTFRARMQLIDRCAFQSLGYSVLSRLYRECGSDDERNLGIVDSSVALYMIEVALADTLKSFGVAPGGTLGVSLGFFAAVTVAGLFDESQAVGAVIGQAEIVSSHCPPGGMLVVLAPPSLFDQLSASLPCELAAINGPSHFVLAGPRDALDGVEQELKRLAIVSHRLPVDYAFHSRWIDAAAAPLQSLLPHGGRPAIPLVCGRGRRVPVIRPDEFWQIARRPILLEPAVRALEEDGPRLYIDAGPSGTLANLVRALLPPGSRSVVCATLSPFRSDRQSLQAAVSAAANSAAH